MNILLVGCGNIGSRHLQSLLQSKDSLSISIVEPNSNSKKKATELLSDQLNSHSISWLQSIDQLNQNFDLTIVATNAESRVLLIESLLKFGNKRFLLEKMVCQSKNDYEKLIKKFHDNDAIAWINTNRRCFPFFQKLKKIINQNDDLKLSVTTGNKGLGSNAIHFVDLFLWLKNSTKVILIGDHLTNKLYENKRGKQYVEFSGTIFGKIDDSILKISFLPQDNLPLILDIKTKHFHFILNESTEQLLHITKHPDLDISFDYLHVSDLTLSIATNIIKDNSCCLPKLDDLFIAHTELFKIFNSHVKKLTNKELTNCPIT